jgi:hypothetical protein
MGQAHRPERIAVGVIVVVAVALSGASLVAAPTSAITLALVAPYGLVGVLLAIRRPSNPIGWIFLAILLVFASSLAAEGLGGAAVKGRSAPLPGGLPLALIWVETWAYAAMFGLYYALTVVFPSGRLPAGRVGRAVRASFVVPVGAIIAGGFGPHLAGNFSSVYLGRTLDNPVGLLPFPDGLDGLLEIATIGLLVGGVVSMIVRFRRAHGIEREQLKWLVASLALTAVLIVATVSVLVAVPRVGTAIWIFALLGFATIPPAVGIAVLRYRLYEIDRIVSRTVGWAVVSAVLLAVFVSVILVTQALLASITTSNTLAVAASTLVVAALFQPIRRRVQTRVDRRFNRARYDADGTVAAFVSRLREQVDLDQLRDEMNGTVAQTVQPTSLGVWLRE